MTPLQAIRKKCLDCCCGQANEVRLCVCKDDCTLWQFRFGHNPARKGVSGAGNKNISNYAKNKKSVSETVKGERKDGR